MNQMQENIQKYLRVPLYFLCLAIVLTAIGFLLDPKIGLFGVVFTVIYAVVVLIMRHIFLHRFQEELVAFAVTSGSDHGKLLENMHLPYAMFDEKGTLLWENECFSNMSMEDAKQKKLTITQLFREIDKALIAKIDDQQSIEIQFQDKIYTACLQIVPMPKEVLEKDKAEDAFVNDKKLYSILLFDETKRKQAEQEIDNQRLVTGIIYIDNYEETLDAVDDVKRSLLSAVVDRKIQRYFEEADGIVRKLEKDRLFVVFQKRYLQKLEDNKFSLLEDIKTIKVGNDVQITLSIGIGLDGDSYQQNIEFSRVALSLALGRGGSQAVIKAGGNVTYFGLKGKEVEKNTRVKARVKALALRELIESREKIFVMGHALTDFDALGAAIGIYCAAREVEKPCHIIINNITRTLRPVLESFTDSEDYPENLFITSKEALEMVTGNSLVIVVDTNRPKYTECPELLDKRSVVVFDHHRQGNDQIENPLLSYVEPYASSTCEMIAEILQYFSERIYMDPKEADSIYAGMLIDTNNFLTKTGVRTFEAAAYLRRNGAEVTRVRKLLREDMTAYKARAEIVRQAEVYRNMFAFSVCETEEVESPTVVGAQAANELLNIVGIKASFVLTNYANKIYVSSRSIDEIDVQMVMERLGGGGHLNIAGAQIEEDSIENVTQRIKDVLDQMIEDGEIVI